MTKGRKTTYEERIAFVKECMLLRTDIHQPGTVGFRH